MRPCGCPELLEERRRLVVARVLEGYEPSEVADFLDVDVSSVYRWLDCYRQYGDAGLEAMPVPGRPSRLTRRQAKRVLGWLKRAPEKFGFPTSRWTAPRLAIVLARDLGIQFPPRYLNAWLREHRISPQIPTGQARERNPEATQHWIRYKWPIIKKSPREECDSGFHR
jgi:transposase